MEAVFNALDREKCGFVVAHEVLATMQTYRDRLAQLNGHGFHRRLDGVLEA